MRWSILSYYDYYQPEAYVLLPTLILKKTSINDEIDNLGTRQRHYLKEEMLLLPVFLYIWPQTKLHRFNGIFKTRLQKDRMIVKSL